MQICEPAAWAWGETHLLDLNPFVQAGHQVSSLDIEERALRTFCALQCFNDETGWRQEAHGSHIAMLFWLTCHEQTLEEEAEKIAGIPTLELSGVFSPHLHSLDQWVLMIISTTDSLSASSLKLV
jgi:hypothetical protein